MKRNMAVGVTATRRSERPKRTPLDADEFLLDIDAEILAAENPEKREDEFDPAYVDVAAPYPPNPLTALTSVDVGGQAVHSSELSIPMPIPVKKKRGRPRKHPIPPPDVNQVPVVKRPRGRPRGSGKHQRAALARSLSVSLTTSSDAGAEDHIAPSTGDQQHHTPPPATVGAIDDQTPVSHALDTQGTPSYASQMSQVPQEGRRRRRKGSMPSRGV